MSNVIDFLERMGASAGLRTAGADGLARELTAAAVDDGLAQAILAGDALALREQIAPGVFYAIQMDDTPPDEHEEQDDEETSVHMRLHRA
ncbi:hypothetical protein SAMN02800694_1143 [Luteibacter sp. UNCMF331Sha3.1]|uniref:hypothetical protein n=1 Tax=Luteibacter sp. UNCMF331Sha3.1 TaxID=1502760 RepID=UPI0008C3F899|nr:hypothetical protein [Luteibacter sp. UNCMF331Sha3.1]SEM45529.1 hypothetical protein SAMN02800694_1143 [Luteibacter sp. UNCMF331Sha3.1]